MIKTVQIVLAAALVLGSSSVVSADPSASISASPESCFLSAGGSCEVTLSYTVTDVPDGWIVEVADSGFDFLEPISAPGSTVSDSLDVLVQVPGKTFGVVLNQGAEDDELLATIFVSAVQEALLGDMDGDSIPDDDDAFPDDPTEWQDTDGDGVGNNSDAFPNDSTESRDTDGDGVGDNSDAFPDDPTEWQDSDGDGIGDNADNGGSDGSGSSGGNTGGSDGDGDTDSSDSDGDSGSTDGGDMVVTGRATANDGLVELTREGESTSSSVAEIDELREGDVVRTGDEVSADLTFQDNAGGTATIVLDETSELRVEELDDATNDTVWSVLNSGQVSVEFDRELTDNDRGLRRCPVRTPNAGVCTRGTEYTVEYSFNGEIGITIISVTEGTVELISASGELIALIDAGESFTYEALQAAGFAEIADTYSGTTYLMTTSGSANVTHLHIINTSDVAQSFTGTLYDASGTRLGPADQSLASADTASEGRLILTSQDLEIIFGVDAWPGPAMLEIKGIAPFEVMTKLTSPSGLISNTNCVREDRVLNIEGFDSGVMTFVRFINTSDTTISDIRGTLYDEAGDTIGAADVSLISSLGPKQQVWINRNQLAGLAGSEWSGVAMLEVGDKEGLKLLNLNFINGDTFFNFSCFENSDAGFVYLQTTSISRNISFTHLVNTSASPQQFTGTLYDESGARLGSGNQVLHEGMIAANGRLILSSSDLEFLFGVSAWSGPALLEVEGNGTFELMTKLTSPSGLVSNSNCVRDRQVHNIEGFDSSRLSFVRLINTGSDSLTGISGNLYDSNGDVVGTGSRELIGSLPGKSAVWLNRDDLSDLFDDTWVGEASLEVTTTDNALKLLNLNFANGETFSNFSCYEFGF